MKINHSDTALLVLDVQSNSFSGFPDSQPLIYNIQEAISKARMVDIQVAYLKCSSEHANMPGDPGRRSPRRMFLERLPESGIHAAVAPIEGDIIFVKGPDSILTGKDIDTVLGRRGFTKLAVTGYPTSGTVLNTVREIAERDYDLTVISDGCGDPETAVHHDLMTNTIPQLARVLTARQWIASL
jgi:nicotinamidase-related amidase